MIPATHIIELTYIIAVVLFILSLKWLSSPATARHGVWAGEVGMLLAIVGTLFYRGIVDYKWIAIALVLGAIILAGEHKSTLAAVLGTIAIVAATSNIVGGFIITDRMLKMFKSSRTQKP